MRAEPVTCTRTEQTMTSRDQPNILWFARLVQLTNYERASFQSD